jgi:hypothetical protein
MRDCLAAFGDVGKNEDFGCLAVYLFGFTAVLVENVSNNLNAVATAAKIDICEEIMT